jgi:hypothetical protein
MLLLNLTSALPAFECIVVGQIPLKFLKKIVRGAAPARAMRKMGTSSTSTVLM